MVVKECRCSAKENASLCLVNKKFIVKCRLSKICNYYSELAFLTLFSFIVKQ